MPIELYNQNCIDAMRKMPDKYYSLCIADPPYGINAGKGFGRSLRENKKIIIGDWDSERPCAEYFNELFRVSQNQIIFGGNYFIDYLFPTRCFIVWDKQNSGRDFADCEYIWTSFDAVARIFTNRVANGYKDRFHPCQKPVKIYEYLLKNYAKQGDRILDTHLGSGSIAIACCNMGFDLTGFEINKDYYNAAIKRLEEYKKQMMLFKPMELTQKQMLLA